MALTLNNFTGFETQSGEEAASTTSVEFETVVTRSGSSALSLNASGDEFSLPWVVSGATDAGGKYIFGFAFYLPSNSTSYGAIRIEDDTGVDIARLVLVGDETVIFQDANASTLGAASSVLGVAAWHYVEVYADLNSASGDWEWFVDGSSIDSGTGADFTQGNAFGGSASTFNIRGAGSQTIDVFYDDVYILSNAASADDRLGPVQVLGYQAGANTSSTGTPTNGNFTETGDTPGVEEADGTALEANGASALTLVTDLDDALNDRGLVGGPGGLSDTYFFDLSDASVSDPEGVWSDGIGDAGGAFDNSSATRARSNSSNAGSVTFEELAGEGTSAPGSGGTITSVYFRVEYLAFSSPVLNVEIATDGRGETLLSTTYPNVATIQFSGWDVLTVPSGGWTWAKIQALEIRFWDSSTSGNSVDCRLHDLLVNHSSGSDAPHDVSGTIIGAKYVYNLKRGNGSGTSLRYLYGNTGETATSSANIEGVLTTAYVIFEQISVVSSVVPTSLENFRFGISAGTDDTGGREIFAADIWAMLLHAPLVSSITLAALSEGIMGSQNSFEGPFEI